MFEFFKGFIGSLELKLIDNFSNKVSEFINNLFLECKNKKDNTTGIEASSGYGTQQASSGNYTQQAVEIVHSMRQLEKIQLFLHADINL